MYSSKDRPVRLLVIFLLAVLLSLSLSVPLYLNGVSCGPLRDCVKKQRPRNGRREKRTSNRVWSRRAELLVGRSFGRIVFGGKNTLLLHRRHADQHRDGRPALTPGPVGKPLTNGRSGVPMRTRSLPSPRSFSPQRGRQLKSNPSNPGSQQAHAA